MIEWKLSSLGRNGAPIAAVAASLLLSMATPNVVFSDKLDPVKHIPGAEKYELTLLHAAVEADRRGERLVEGVGRNATSRTDQGIQLELIVPGLDDRTIAEIKKSGAKIINETRNFNRLVVEVDDFQSLTNLGAIDKITMIKNLHRPVKRGVVDPLGLESGNVISGGLRALGADDGQSQFGVDGSGVTVGILSDSFNRGGIIIHPDTEFLGAEANLPPLVLSAGNYTVVVETSEESEVSLQFSSDVELLAPNEDFPDEEVNCRGRVALTGNGETVTRTSEVLSLFPSSSCGPGGTTFALYGFRVPAGQVANVNLSAFPGADGGDISLSVRGDCNDLASEIACVEGDVPIFQTIIELDNQKSGDLPGRVIVLEDGLSGIDEGAAMAEIIHDIAPGAQLAFHTAFLSPASFATGIQKLAGIEPAGEDTDGFDYWLESDVIVDDVAWLGLPVYQTDVISWAVERAVDGSFAFLSYNPVAYFSSAGNSGNYAIRENFRDYRGGDDTTIPPTGNDFHVWNSTGNPYLPITVEKGASFEAYLHWNQPGQSTVDTFGGSEFDYSRIDLDMILSDRATVSGVQEMYSYFGTANRRLSKEKNGSNFRASGDPLEFVQYINNTDEKKTLYLVIEHYDGNQDKLPQMDEKLEFTLLFNPSPGVQVAGIDSANPDTGAPTIWGHSAAVGAIGVGAVNYLDTPGWQGTSFGPTTEIDMEPFSSKGGTIRRYFDEVGFPNRTTVAAPTLSSVDGLNTTFFVDNKSHFSQLFPGLPSGDFDLDGFPNFFGTSASAPSAAAVAALMKQLNSGLTPDQIRAAMVETADDVKGFLAKQGADDYSGAGLVNARNALQYVESRFGRTTGVPAPVLLDWDFGSDTEGWTTDYPTDFTDPQGARQGQALTLTAVDNTNTFGWWESPLLQATRFQTTDSDVLTIGNLGPGTSIYRIEYRVSSTAAEASMTPSFRLRTSSLNYEHASEMTVTSTQNGEASPYAGNPQNYFHFFEPASTQSKFRIFFDVLGFNVGDADGAVLGLESVVINPVGTNGLTDQQFHALYNFSNSNKNGWTFGSASDLAAPSNGANSTGLRFGPAGNSQEINFGFWGSPENNAPAQLVRDRIYRATFQVTSNIAVDSKTQLPPFRMRLNNGGYQLASLVMISSTVESAQIPVNGATETYRVWFEAPESITTTASGSSSMANLNLSFDYIYVPGEGDNAEAEITLKALRLDSFQAPAKVPPLSVSNPNDPSNPDF